MKLKTTIITALLAITLTGCGDTLETTRTDRVIEAMETWTDPSTGCRYYVTALQRPYQGYAFMTIRHREDGTPDCPGTGEEPAS